MRGLLRRLCQTLSARLSKHLVDLQLLPLPLVVLRLYQTNTALGQLLLQRVGHSDAEASRAEPWQDEPNRKATTRLHQGEAGRPGGGNTERSRHDGRLLTHIETKLSREARREGVTLGFFRDRATSSEGAAWIPPSRQGAAAPPAPRA